MSSYSKTVDSYEGFVQLCSGYGGYHPGSSNLQLKAMHELAGHAREALQAMQDARSIVARATNDREIAFANLPRLTSGISFALASTGASEQTMKDVRAILRQMTSKKRYRPPMPSGAETESLDGRSFSQRGYEAMVNHFTDLVKLVEQEPLYQPFEDHLQKRALHQVIGELHELNQAVRIARANFSHTRVILRELFYSSGNSLVTTGRAAKKYLRSVFGLHSSEYKQVLAFKFTKPPR